MYLELTRLMDDGVQTTGTMQLLDSVGNCLLRFQTLELPWKNNERKVSCVPDGTYVVKTSYSLRFGFGFALQNVPNRDCILIHAGNFNKDTKGCILIGQGYRDLNGDGALDVLNSKLAMKNLLNTLKSTTTINIKYVWKNYELER